MRSNPDLFGLWAALCVAPWQVMLAPLASVCGVSPPLRERSPEPPARPQLRLVAGLDVEEEVA